jgi:hypothetical protein
MKTNRLVLIVGFISMASFAFAQDYAFRVMANKGSNEVKSGDAWQTIKAGSNLKSGDELKISENSYLGLIHASGRPVELRQPGSYKVADLAAKVSGGASVLNKYTDFILSSNAEGKKNKLSATGAVHRGLEDIKVYLPENNNSEIFNTTAIINWEAGKNGGPYVVTFKNLFDDEMKKIETPETSVTIDISAPEFANENAILVEVKSKADAKSKSEQHLIKKMSAAQQTKIKGLISELGNDAKNEAAINKFIMAGFYEQNNLLIDAIVAYEQAIKMAPDVPTYKEFYEEFLLRNKLKTPKQ